MHALTAALSIAGLDTVHDLAERGLLLLLYITASTTCCWTAITIKRSCAARRNEARQPSAGYRRRRRFWYVAAGALLVVGVALELGIIDRVIEQFRVLACAQGWYHNRWLVQSAIVGITILVLVCLVAFIWRHRSEWYRRDRWATAVLLALVGFISVRALSQHHLEVLLSIDLLHITLGRWVELLILAALCITATWTMRCRRAAPARARQLRQCTC